jgi:hypothetical protein
VAVGSKFLDLLFNGMEGDVLRRHIQDITLVAIALYISIGLGPALAQDGKLTLHVMPHQAYVFVDGRAISEASKCRSLKLSPGHHKIELVNYGYSPATRDVVITPGGTTDVEASLIPVSSSVSEALRCDHH